MKTPLNPHDGLFKSTFSDPEIVRDYLRNFLPKEISEKLQLDSLKLLPNSFLSPKLEAFYSDLIYQCKLGEVEMLVSLLFEHKSTPQKYPHIQLLRYMISTWEDQIKQKKPLLPIIPIIVYHGKKKWKQRSFEEYFEKGVDTILKSYLPLFTYHLTDLSNWSDESLENMKMGLLYNTFLLMKHFGDIVYIERYIHKLLDISEQDLASEKSRNHIQTFFVYLFSTAKIDESLFHQIFGSIPDNLKDDAMTLYERLILKGEKKGEHKTQDHVIKASFQEKLPLETIARIANLSMPELKTRLKKLGLIPPK